jgi:carbon starvation protein
MSNVQHPNRLALALWALVGALALVSLYTLANARGESVNAMWLVTAAVCVYAIAYRFYARFIAERVLRLDAARRTPAHRHNDGLDYVPTDKYVLFGHHFAAIAGAGPLVGPVLAAQMGYLPGTLWLLFGVVFAGAVQDFIVLFISTRRDGRSLGDLIKTEMGPVPGIIAMVGILAIMIILLAVLGLVVIKALADSPWGSFTVFATLPIAVLMGVYGRYLRPGHVGEMSAIGFVLLIASIAFGRVVAESATLAPLFTFRGETLAFMLIGYGFIASVLPVWLLLAPRDYLSTFLKIGTIVSLALGIALVWPALRMPAVSRFIEGTGPVFAGSLFPFLFITIACGAVSGFHSLVCSGTTPKMMGDESQARFIGYGAMLMESFVAIMALVAASTLQPGVYFAMNSPGALIGTTPDQAASVISSWGFAVTPQTLIDTAREVGEKTILSRTGGAPTLAVGMAQILSSAIGGAGALSFWYHFAILFEALFILTTIDAGTRIARFLVQEFGGRFYKPMEKTDWLPGALFSTALVVFCWGYFIWTGNISTIWPMFGTANQLLAAVALAIASTALVNAGKQRYLWVTLPPLAFVAITTLYAAWRNVFDTFLPMLDIPEK